MAGASAVHCASFLRAFATIESLEQLMSRHAVVIGASVAGLLAARVLARHFDAVTVVERDAGDQALFARKGVPQGNHIHLLWSGGMRIIEGLFPGIAEDLVAAGGAVFDNGRDMRWYHHGVWKLRHDSGLKIHAQSRPLLEHTLRRRLLETPHVRLLSGHMVQGLQGTPGGGRVTGVVVKPVGAGAAEFSLEADLVVDASGRSGVTLGSLERLGCARPEEESIGVDIGYATRVFHQPQDGRDWKAMAVYTTAPRTHRLGVVFPIEGDRWIVTLVGLRGHYTRSSDPAAFLEFAASLEQPDLYEAIRHAEPEGPVHLIGYANQMRRRFERLSAFPPGLLYLGDSICSLNPLYGQGMTLCALQADILDRCLERNRGRAPDAALARDYFRRAASVVDSAWLLGAGSDFLYPETTGPRPPFTPLLGWYITRLLQLSGRSEVVQMRFLQVIHFVRPIWSLMLPDVVLRVLGSPPLRRRAAT
jgi:2-polyprenyl-6-methoxyphenol hydroxylase-like FAD-dependent oxidoreductase